MSLNGYDSSKESLKRNPSEALCSLDLKLSRGDFHTEIIPSWKSLEKKLSIVKLQTINIKVSFCVNFFCEITSFFLNF